MIQIIKTSEPFQYWVDLSVLISAIAMLFILFAELVYRPPVVKKADEPKVYNLTPPEPLIPETEIIKEVFEMVRTSEYEPDTSHLEEIPDMSALFYATVPIGRYYITAYNHKETGSKQTASGTTCHEGNITTCAADVWGGYFKFGDYIEVGGRLYRVEDTGSAVKKKHIDLYFASYSDMARYGSNYQEIYRVEFPFGKPQDNY